MGFNDNIINETTRRVRMNFINLKDLKSVTWEPQKYSLVTMLGAGYGTLIFDDGNKKLKLNCVENIEDKVKKIEEIRESVKEEKQRIGLQRRFEF